jgi:hypothetical protein
LDGTELLKRADLPGSKRNSAVAALQVIFLTQQLAVGGPTTGLAPVTLASLVGQLPAAAAPVDPTWTLPGADQPAGGAIKVELTSGVKLRLTGAVDEVALYRVDRQRVVVTVALKKLSL